MLGSSLFLSLDSRVSRLSVTVERWLALEKATLPTTVDTRQTGKNLRNKRQYNWIRDRGVMNRNFILLPNDDPKGVILQYAEHSVWHSGRSA